MSLNYLLGDTSSLIYTYRAGGPQLLDRYVEWARNGGYELCISNTVRDELYDGPLEAEFKQYVASRRISVLNAPKIEQLLDSATTREERKKLAVNAGEKSLIEIAAREQVDGRDVAIWSDDKYFASPQIQRQLQRDLPGLQTKTSADLLDQSFQGNFITETEYQQHVAGYRTDQTFRESPRLNSFDPSLSTASATATAPSSTNPDPPDVSPSGPKDQRGFASTKLLIGEVPRNTLIRSGGLLATGADLSVSAQRVAELLEQDNPTAAQSEAAHAVARNVGGWAGGTAAASLVGTSGYLPLTIVMADAMLMSKAFDKAVDLKENYEITHQKDKQQVAWTFNGHNWVRDGLIDKTNDDRDDPVEAPLGAGYEKARELGARASVTAVELALGKAPRPQDPFDIPAAAGDQIGIDNQNWRRDPTSEEWQRWVKADVTGPNDRGTYERQKALPERAMELNREAVGRIQHNIANGRESVAAAYLESYTAQRSSDFEEIPPAVQAVRPRHDEVFGSDGQLYRRGVEGEWTGRDRVAQGNLALELELTNAAREPSLRQFDERIAALEARPALTEQQRAQNHLLHQYRITPERIELTPEWQQAIELAVQRTREQHGITGPGSTQLLRHNGAYGADSPIAHYQRDADDVSRLVAQTSSEDILQARNEVLARNAKTAPVADSPEPHITAQSPRELEAQELPHAAQTSPAQSSASNDALRRGSDGQDVALLQYRLDRMGYRGPDESSLPQHGYFDAATEHGVLKFQEANGLPTTGVVDPETVQALAVAQQSGSVRSATAAQQGESFEPVHEPVALSRDAAPASVAPTPTRDEREEARDAAELAHAQPIARPTLPAADVRSAQPAPARIESEPAIDLSSFSPADQAMMTKIRGKVPDSVTDEHVAAAMLAAKRNGIGDADSLGPIGVVNDALWMDRTVPGFHTGVNLAQQAPRLQDTLRETLQFNQEPAQSPTQAREQQQDPDGPTNPTRPPPR